MNKEAFAISYKNITKIYKRSHLGKVTKTVGLENFSLEINKGEIFGMLGLNGAGKTTAMKLVSGLLFPTEGEVYIFGEKASQDGAKKKIGYLPELPYFYSYLTAVESLMFYGRLSGMQKDKLVPRVCEVLQKVGLEKNKRKKLSEFSKGMLQRIGFAQALIHNPEIIMLDEPVSGLDPLAVADFRDMLSELNKEGKTIFLSSHSISEVEKICHRAAILKTGRLAKIISQQDWQNSGGLEDIFIQTIKQ